MVQAHIKYLSFHLYLTRVESQAFKSATIKPILLELIRIFALKSLIDDCGPVFAAGYFVPAALQNMKQALD